MQPLSSSHMRALPLLLPLPLPLRFRCRTENTLCIAQTYALELLRAAVRPDAGAALHERGALRTRPLGVTVPSATGQCCTSLNSKERELK